MTERWKMQDAKLRDSIHELLVQTLGSPDRSVSNMAVIF